MDRGQYMKVGQFRKENDGRYKGDAKWNNLSKMRVSTMQMAAQMPLKVPPCLLIDSALIALDSLFEDVLSTQGHFPYFCLIWRKCWGLVSRDESSKTYLPRAFAHFKNDWHSMYSRCQNKLPLSVLSTWDLSMTSNPRYKLTSKPPAQCHQPLF